MVAIKTGDILNATQKIIVNPVNCIGRISDQALLMFEVWPVACNDYRQLTQRIPDRSMLLGMAHLTGEQKDGHVICNLYCSFYLGEYNPKALEDSLYMLAKFAQHNKWSVAMPHDILRNREEVLSIICRAMKDVECVIYRDVSNK